MRRYLLKTALCSTMLTLGGCSSVMSHTGGSEQGYYPGTRSSYNMLTSNGPGWGMKSFVAVDMPFTAILDTLLLPWDAFRNDKSVKSRVEESERSNDAVNNAIPPAS